MQTERHTRVSSQNEIYRVDHSRSARDPQQSCNSGPVLIQLNQHIRHIPQSDLPFWYGLKRTPEIYIIRPNKSHISSTHVQRNATEPRTQTIFTCSNLGHSNKTGSCMNSSSEDDLTYCECPCRPSLARSHQRGFYSVHTDATEQLQWYPVQNC